MIKQALNLAYKDFLIEAGQKKLLTSLFFLAFVLIFLSSFVILKNPGVKTEMAALSIWLVLVYIMFQTLNRSLGAEDEMGCWEALLLCPVAPQAIFLGKLIYNFSLVVMIELVVFPFYMLFFALSVRALLILIPLILASLGFTAVGLLISLLALHNQGRELLANLISLPLYLPALFLGVAATIDILHGASLGEAGRSWLLIGIYDVLFMGIAWLAFGDSIND